MAEENGQNLAVDLSGLGSFDFAPSWASGDKVVAKKVRDRDGDGERSVRNDRPQRRFESSKGAGDARRGESRPFAGRDGDGKGGKPRFEKRPGGGDRREFRKREFIKPLEAEIRVLPAQKELGGIIRKIQTGFSAYPLKQIAYFFLDHPEACRVKVTPKDTEKKFFVCKACGHSCFSEEALEAHITAEHLKDYYSAEETDVEPPSGQFGCVVKCGITGELLSPPNLHEYNAKVREMARKLGMNENDYRSRLVTVRDQESVEAWRQSATRKTFYRLKAAEAASAEEGAEAPAVPALELEQAEAEFRRNILPQLKSVSKSSEMSLEQALKSTDLPYLFAVRDAISKERRFPASLFYALRGAFHHRKFQFFRANDPRGQEFVCAVKPAPLDTDHAVAELCAVVKFVAEHPLCHVNELPEEMKGHLGWLVEKGHVVQYFNGLLASPEAHPKFRNVPVKKVAGQVAEAPTAAVSEPPAEPIPEAPATEAPATAEVPEAEVPAGENAEDGNGVVETVTAAEPPVAEEKKEEARDETAGKLAE